ncbi:response regulator [Planctomicrobium sp.]|jgi:chemotaxis response regulator CheB|nr:response regulator [Planctomicrobium sp.]MBT5020950.1 response regulator [Planctomicrobium sp.]MDB4733586.1 response regulator [Planctomicrobium sp.]
MWSSRVRVIFADDGALMRHLFQETFDKNDNLEIAGYAKSAREVIGLFQARSPQIVLIDEDLLGVPGSEIVRELRTLDAEIAIIGLVSATTKGREEGTEMIIQGANSYVEKPVITGHPQEAIRLYEESVLPELIAWGEQLACVRQDD